MTIFLSGGCKNGKSTLAEDCACALAGGGPLYYLATMIPHDGEDRARIRRHVAERSGKGFTTIECGRDILTALDGADPNGTFLLDSVTALLSNEMFREDGSVELTAGERTAEGLAELARRVRHAVFVSDYIYGDGSYDALTEAYRAGLARCDRALAAACDAVVEVCVGQYVVYRGALPVAREGGSTWN